MTIPAIPAIPVDVLKERVVELIADGMTLAEVARVGNMPSAYTIAKWRREDMAFADDVAFAMQQRALAYAEETVRLADRAGDIEVTVEVPDDTGESRRFTRIEFDGERVRKAALQVQTRQWHAERLLPKMFGSRVAHEHAGPDGGAMRLLIGPTAEAYDAAKSSVPKD